MGVGVGEGSGGGVWLLAGWGVSGASGATGLTRYSGTATRAVARHATPTPVAVRSTRRRDAARRISV
ncbi:hypothetical protein H3146_22615 [Streptomyces sp. OF3]|uniref:Uncharacterized protein n=1 Tax=Streptomyces alkaliterrae TaxID=2213162 RepID=A0A7W3WPH4_9ACTN|nr:hypothetical protein [Streptomyces alkaliterrae]MBB1256129.1 hypothetical protein [Streptomyces alkaliterrae]MBB1262052.1 hypothetical protein [Streptomyces alkaliterrae]